MNASTSPPTPIQHTQRHPGGGGPQSPAAPAPEQHRHQQPPPSAARRPLARPPAAAGDAAADGAGAGGDDEAAEKRGWKYGRNEGGMGWGWKLVCAILYMLPWTDVTEKTVFFIERFPAFAWAEYFTEPFEHWFYIHEWAPLIIFFGTYLGIVRNKKISHVARYHVMMVRASIVCSCTRAPGQGLARGVDAPPPPKQKKLTPPNKPTTTTNPPNTNRASCSTSSL